MLKITRGIRAIATPPFISFPKERDFSLLFQILQQFGRHLGAKKQQGLQLRLS